MHQRLVSELVRVLKGFDWPLRHIYFRRIAERNDNLANDIRHQMSPDELLDGLCTGHRARDVIPLGCGVRSYLRSRIP